MIGLMFAVCAALSLTALCSIFESVLYSIPLSHIEMLAEAGHKSGKILKDLRSNVHRPITAIITLNTIAAGAGAAVSGAIAADVLGHRWLAYFTVAFTFCMLIFSEVMPKTAGIVYSRRLAPLIARPLQLVTTLFTPAIWLCQLAARLIRKERDEPEVAVAEIRALVKMSRKRGEIQPDEERIIQNILSLKTKRAHQIMTPRTVVFSLSEHLTLDEARKRAGLWPHARVPIYDKDPEDIVGIVMRRDVFNAIADGHLTMQLSALMKPVHFVPELVPADTLLLEFIERRQHLFVVIDEHGGLSGVVTLEDVLEEIVGREIVDEHETVVDMREHARQRRRQVIEKRP
jgi:CBS domain containing-hemolysin-like protein